MELFFLIAFFVLGLIVGSFLNVVVLRFGTGKTFGGRSACMSCQQTLRWHELIPLFSFLFLRGRCGTCATRISWQYPLVEFTTGIVFALLFQKFSSFLFVDNLSFTFTYAYYAVLFSLLMAISVYDIKHQIIPDVLSFTFGLLAFIGMFFFSPKGIGMHLPTFADFLAGLLVSIPFALLWLVSRGRWMGLGDAKLAVGLGFMLGVVSLLSATVIGFWIGSIVGVGLILFNKIQGLKSEVPLGPFLALGAFLVFVFDWQIFQLFW